VEHVARVESEPVPNTRAAARTEGVCVCRPTLVLSLELLIEVYVVGEI